MSDSYYRDRIDRALIEQENARIARMAALDEALAAVLYEDAEVIDGADRETLSRARQIIQELRRTW